MKKLTAIGAASGAFLLSAIPAFAAQTQTVNPCPANTGPNSFTKLCNLTLNTGSLIPNLINIAFIVATLIALAFLIYGGIRWILSGGEKEKVEEARGTIIAALVGLVVVFLSYFLINFIFGLFGLSFGTFTLSFSNIFK